MSAEASPVRQEPETIYPNGIIGGPTAEITPEHRASHPDMPISPDTCGWTRPFGSLMRVMPEQDGRTDFVSNQTAMDGVRIMNEICTNRCGGIRLKCLEAIRGSEK